MGTNPIGAQKPVCPPREIGLIESLSPTAQAASISRLSRWEVCDIRLKSVNFPQ